MHYRLSVKDGTVLTETGHFFKALPFNIIMLSPTLAQEFQHLPTWTKSPSLPPNKNTTAVAATIAAWIKSIPPQYNLSITFERGKAGKVVFKIYHHASLLAECMHPDYVPEDQPGTSAAPTTLSPAMHYAMCAFLYLGIAKEKSYTKLLHPLEGEKKLAFHVIQTIPSALLAPATSTK